MKQILLLLLTFIGLQLSVFAQVYYNEWIDYDKTYFKITVEEKGIYRIPTNSLPANLQNVNGSNFILFYKGKEVALYVTTNSALGNNDYLEFYGEPNDGEFDTQLYPQPSDQLYKTRSLFVDAATYYLTSDNTNNHLRYEQTNNNLNNPPAKEDFFIQMVIREQLNSFFSGKPNRISGVNYSFAEVEPTEGFVSSLVSPGSTKNVTINTPNVYRGTDAPAAVLTAKVVGRLDDFTTTFDHHMKIRINDQLYIDDVYSAYDSRTYATSILNSDVADPLTRVIYESVGDKSAADQNSIVSTALKYPHTFDFEGQRRFGFMFEGIGGNREKYIEVSNFQGDFSPVLYDLTNRLRIDPVFENELYKFLLPTGENPNIDRSLFFTSSLDDLGITILKQEDLTETQFTDFSQVANQGNYIILTHPILQTGATDYVQAYADYRSSATGGGYNVTIVNVNELYDQFAWGINKHFLSIRNFVNYAVDNWTIAPAYMLLLGKSVAYNTIRTNPSSFLEDCLVPTYGYQPSDNSLVARNDVDYFPQLAVGRISAKTAEEVRAYLDKVIEYESPKACTREARAWTKNFVHIANGKTNNEVVEFTGFLDEYKGLLDTSTFGGQVVATYDHHESSNSSQNPSEEDMRQHFEDGTVMVTLMGHSGGSDYWWQVNIEDPERYEMNGQYPFFLSGSCFVGNIHRPSPGSADTRRSMAEEYVLADNHGAIAFLATVSFGFPRLLHLFMNELYLQFTSVNYGKPLGFCMQETLKNLHIAFPSNTNELGLKATLEEFTLAGDPAIVLGGYQHPEFIIENNAQFTDVRVFNDADGQELTGSPIVIDPTIVNAIRFDISVTNLGVAVAENYSVDIINVATDGSETVLQQATFGSATNQTIHSLLLSDLPVGNYNLAIRVNGNQAIEEDCFDNNEVNIALQIEEEADVCAELADPVINTENLAIAYCVNDAVIPLSATPSPNEGGTGVFSGPGVTGNNFNPNTAGEGTHTIRYDYTFNDSGCTKFTIVNVAVKARPVADIDDPETTSICLGNQLQLSALAVANGDYNWSFGTGATIVEGTENGPYTIDWDTPGQKEITLLVNKDGCASEQASLTITVEPPLAIPLVNCGEATANSVNVNWDMIAGAIGYQVVIDGVVAANLMADELTYQQTGLEGNAEVTAEIVALGIGVCGNATSIPVSCVAQEACPPIEVTINNLNSRYCRSDDPITLAGTPADGTFQIDGITATTFNPNNLGAGNYEVTYRIEDGDCVFTSPTSQIEVLPSPAVEITGSAVYCAGSSTTLSVNNLNGSAEDIVGYNWSTTATTPTIEVSTDGAYNVTIMDQNGCTTTASIAVNQAPEQPLSIDLSNDPLICALGSSLNLLATEGFEDYVWSGAGSVEPSLIVTSPGSYGVTATDANGCTWSAETIIRGNLTEPEILVDGEFATSTCGESATLSLSDPTYISYSWSAGDNPTNSSITVQEAGEYMVVIVDEDGCEKTATLALELNNLSNISITSSPTENTICAGTTVNLTADPGFDSYSWSNGMTEQMIIVTIEEATELMVTVTKGECSGSQAISFEVLAEPTASLVSFNSESEGATICAGESISLQNLTEGSVNQTWTLTNESSGVSVNSSDANPDFTLTEAGNYTVMLSADIEHTCGIATDLTQMMTEFVTVNAIFSVDIDPATLPATICEGDEITLNALTIGGSPSFLWQSGGQSLDDIGNNISFIAGEAGTTVYEVSTTEACSQTASFSVTVEPIFTVDIEAASLPDLICPGDEITLNALTTGDASFIWEEGGQALTETNNSLTIVAGDEGTTVYEVSTTEACSEKSSFDITISENCSFDIPNAITPNNDNFNDTWIIPQANTNSNITVELYNRWGQKVYSQAGYSNGSAWDGTADGGKELAHGTYYYVIFLNDGSEPIGGNVTILR